MSVAGTGSPLYRVSNYSKDMRPEGRLKMGHGPGGPPVFEALDVVNIVAQMIERGCLDAGEVKSALGLTTT